MTANKRLISLLTDFGLEDEYVGVMKGMILKHRVDLQIVDLCHTVRPQDIRQAAYFLESSYPYFPEETIHVAVVDPGVGTARKILLVVAEEQYFIGPDNGVLTPLLLKPSLSGCYRLNIPENISNTFHGRDVMAPAAARLACGELPETLGEKIGIDGCVTLPPAMVQISAETIVGEVIHIDHFGNLASSINSRHLDAWGTVGSAELGSIRLKKMGRTFGDVRIGETALYINSRGNVEIGINHGNCAAEFGVQLGDKLTLRKKRG